MQSNIHVKVNEAENLPPFGNGKEGYGAECRLADLDDVVHFALESLVDGANPADGCPAPQAAMCSLEKC